jgi:hypothetical protein
MRNTQPQFLLHKKIIVDGVSFTHISDIGQIQELTRHGLAQQAQLADMGSFVQSCTRAMNITPLALGTRKISRESQFRCPAMAPLSGFASDGSLSRHVVQEVDTSYVRLKVCDGRQRKRY